MLQVSYINLISTLSEIKSPLINNDIIINNCIDYIIHENTEKDKRPASGADAHGQLQHHGFC